MQDRTEVPLGGGSVPTNRYFGAPGRYHVAGTTPDGPPALYPRANTCSYVQSSAIGAVSFARGSHGIPIVGRLPRLDPNLEVGLCRHERML